MLLSSIRHRLDKYLTSPKQWLCRRLFTPPPLSEQQQTLVSKMRNEGAVISSLTQLSQLGIDISWFSRSRENLIRELDKIDQDSNCDRNDRQYRVILPNISVEAFPDMLQFGLHPKLLDIIENYIGLPVFFRGVVVRKERADGQAIETRLWHRDGEDVRIFKLFVYLDDVDERAGPFCYIPKSFTDKKKIAQSDERLNDETMVKKLEGDYQIKCTGPAGTTILGDTRAVFHRGLLPIDKPRYAIFFTYNSQIPRIRSYCTALQDLSKFKQQWQLNSKQINCITRKY